MAPPRLPNLVSPNPNDPKLSPALVRYLKDLDRWAHGLDGAVVRYGDPTASGRTEPIYAPNILAAKIRNLPSTSKSGMSTDYLAQLGTITDGSGVTRFQYGNLAALGASPRQYGFRINDASGNPILDTVGIIEGWTGQGAQGGSGTFTTTTDTTTGSTVTFSVSRTQRLFIFLRANCYNSNQNNGLVSIYVDGTDVWDGILNYGFSQTQQITCSAQVSTLVAAGSHTVDVRARVSATPSTFTVTTSTVDCYTLGVS